MIIFSNHCFNYHSVSHKQIGKNWEASDQLLKFGRYKQLMKSKVIQYLIVVSQIVTYALIFCAAFIYAA